MPSNTITDYTRRDLFEHLRIAEINWAGRTSPTVTGRQVFVEPAQAVSSNVMAAS
jgi:hypothetical protein